MQALRPPERRQVTSTTDPAENTILAPVPTALDAQIAAQAPAAATSGPESGSAQDISPTVFGAESVPGPAGPPRGLCPTVQCKFDFQQQSTPSPTPLASIIFDSAINTVYYTTSNQCALTSTTLSAPLTHLVSADVKDNLDSAVASASAYASRQLSWLLSGCSSYAKTDGLPNWLKMQQSMIDGQGDFVTTSVLITSTTTKASSRTTTTASPVSTTGQGVSPQTAGPSASTTGTTPSNTNSRHGSETTIILAAVLTFVVCLVALLACAWWERRRWQRKRWSLEAQASQMRSSQRRRRRREQRALAAAGGGVNGDVSRAESKNRRLIGWLQDLEGKFRDGAKSSSGRSVTTERHELPGDSSYMGETSGPSEKSTAPDAQELNGAETAHQMPVKPTER